MKPIVGVCACNRQFGSEWPVFHAVPARYVTALSEISEALVIYIPPVGEEALSLLSVVDGILFPGSPSNVEPHLYGEKEDQTPAQHDPGRDATTLPLIREAVRRSVPILGICRGVQELNVAFGGTLYQNYRLNTGKAGHEAGEGSLGDKFAPRHKVFLEPAFLETFGLTSAVQEVNSLHMQAIKNVAPGLSVEARAEDGTIEALRVTQASAFAWGIQWHPEWDPHHRPGSEAVFKAFGKAVAARQYTKQRLIAA